MTHQCVCVVRRAWHTTLPDSCPPRPMCLIHAPLAQGMPPGQLRPHLERLHRTVAEAQVEHVEELQRMPNSFRAGLAVFQHALARFCGAPAAGGGAPAPGSGSGAAAVPGAVPGAAPGPGPAPALAAVAARVGGEEAAVGRGGAVTPSLAPMPAVELCTVLNRLKVLLATHAVSGTAAPAARVG